MKNKLDLASVSLFLKLEVLLEWNQVVVHLKCLFVILLQHGRQHCARLIRLDVCMELLIGFQIMGDRSY